MLLIVARRLRPARRLLSPIVSLALLLSALSMLPLLFIGIASVQAGWMTMVTMLVRPRVGELLVNTALLVVAAVPISAGLAVLLSWLTERTDLPGGRIWAWLVVTPLAIPAFVHGYAWTTVLPQLQGFWAAVLVSVLAYTGFLYLPVAAMLRRIDPALEDAAASLGQAPLRVLMHVVLPQLRIALCGGSLLVGLHLLGEYGLFVMIRFDTFTTAIVDQLQSTYSGPAAIMLAGVLVACCLILLCAEAGMRGGARYARVGAGAARTAARAKLGRLTLPALLAPGGFAALAVVMPLLTLVRWLAVGGTSVWRPNEIWSALSQTVLLATFGGVLTAAAAIPAAWLAVRVPGRLQRVVEGSNYVVGALPGVVVALALVMISVRMVRPLYQTLATVLLAYMLMFLPRAILSLRASIAQVPQELEQAAASLGRSPARALWVITIRLAAPGAAAGMALVSLGITNELVATQMLAPNGTQTLATMFWQYSNEIDYAAAAPYALMMILFALPLTLILHDQSHRSAGR